MQPEQVVFLNMTTYEWSYLVLIVIQTVILWGYARETLKLRRTADAQLDAVRRQNETMRLQNETLAKQLETSIEEITHARKFETAKISPLFRLNQVILHNSHRTILVEDIKEKVVYEEIRTNVAWNYGPLSHPSDFKRGILIADHYQNLYIGIRYKRLIDNEEDTIVYSYNTQAGVAKEEKGMDFWSLPVRQSN